MSIDNHIFEAAVDYSKTLERHVAGLEKALSEECELNASLRHKLLDIEKAIKQPSAQCEEVGSDRTTQTCDPVSNSPLGECLDLIGTIARRQGATPFQLQEIERLLRKCGRGLRQA